MITEITRSLNGTYFSGNTTIAFNANPYLLASNDLTIYFNNDFRSAAKVVSVSANNAVIDFSNAQYNNTPVTAITPQYSNGISGAQPTFSFKLSTPPNAILQASTDGGSANVKIQASTDQLHWVDLATLSVSTANSNTAFTNITAPWPYGRLNITDISAGNSLTVNKAI